jgi:hypothetical protein
MYAFLLLFFSLLISYSTSFSAPEINAELAAVLTENPTETVLSLNSPSVEISSIAMENQDFSSVAAFGESHVGQIGMPDLPAVYRTVIIPTGVEVSLRIINDQYSTEDVTSQLLPYTGEEDALNIGIVKTPANVFPPEPVVLGSQKTFRGRQLIDITYYPVQFDPVKNQLIHHENLEVALEFSPEANSNDSPDESIEAPLTRGSYRFLKALTLNPPRRDDNGEALPRGGYLIVAGGGFNNAEDDINALADWKRACGHHVEVVMGETNYTDIINEYIEPAFEEWDPPLEYVCLIGAFGNPNAYNSMGDVYYGLLEGNDHISEVAVSRLSASSANQAQTVIRRALSYQSDPYTGNDMDWCTKAGSISLNVNHWNLPVNYTMHWVAEAERRSGMSTVWKNYYSENNNDGSLNTWFENRVGIVFQRGGQNGSGFQESVFPVFISAGGGHIFDTWNSMWNQGSPNQLRGPSVAAGSQHNQETIACNALVGGMARALLIDGMPVGWARAFAVAMLDYGNCGNFNTYYTEFNLYGDPGQIVWRGIPKEITVQHPERISTGSNRIDVFVEDPEAEIGVPNALVTLTQPGELLSWEYTNEYGECNLSIDPDLEDYVIITVTKDGIIPYSAEIEIEVSDVNLNVTGVRIDDGENGNGDGILNPGETVDLYLTLVNCGNSETAENISGMLQKDSRFIMLENAEFEIGEIRVDQEVEIEEPIVLTLDPSAPGDADLGLNVKLTSGGQSWQNDIFIEVQGPKIQLANIISGEIIEEGLSDLVLQLNNLGDIASSEMTATLISNSYEIHVIDNDTEFESMRPGGQDSATVRSLRINLSTFIVGNFSIPMQLLMLAEGGTIPDTLDFDLLIGRPGDGNPVGPDEYGYICFDDTDTLWQQHPTYEWIEINPDERECDYEGSRLGGNRSDNFAHEMELPFTFTYYGEDFDEVTIAENGFLAMGDDIEDLVQTENFPLDRCMNGSFGMLAPYWDDLRFPGNARDIFTCYVEDEDIFIVEWYKDDLIFEIILYDPEVYSNVSGDGKILFQYREVPQSSAGNAPSYFSAGISSPDGKYGIDYSSDHDYPVGAAEIANRRAMLFTTAPQYRSGVLYGHVIDERTRQPIPDAVVFTEHSISAVTDNEGYWRTDIAPADLLFSVTAAKAGYNDSTLFENTVGFGDSIEINFSLLHPEFTPSRMNFETTLDSDYVEIIPFNIRNTGNGPLNWTLKRELPGVANTSPWESRETFAASDSTGDARLEGVVFANNYFYLSGSNIMDGNDRLNMIWILDRDFCLVDSFEQPGEERYGMRDLAWDGELLWGCDGELLLGFTTEGEVEVSIRCPDGSLCAVAWDVDREVFWVARKTGNYIFAMSRNGDEIKRIPTFGLRIYGFAYWPDAPDDNRLFIFNAPTTETQVVHTVNPDTEELAFVKELKPEAGGTARGAFITNQLDVYSWVFLGIVDDADKDRIDVWQLDARREWFKVFSEVDDERIEVEEGRIEADEISDFELELSTVGLPTVVFDGMLHFFHNAEGEETVLNVSLNVINEPVAPTHFSLLCPADGDTVDHSQLQDTLLVDFGWEPSIDYNAGEDVSYLFCVWKDGETTSFECADTALSVDVSDFCDDLIVPLEWWVLAISAGDTVPSNEHFTLRIQSNDVLDFEENLPCEFGFQSIYPSPFNSKTTIRFGLEKPEAVTLRIYDLAGREVAKLVDQPLMAGYHSIVWDAGKLPSGIYITRLETISRTMHRKVALIK